LYIAAVMMVLGVAVYGTGLGTIAALYTTAVHCGGASEALNKTFVEVTRAVEVASLAPIIVGTAIVVATIAMAVASVIWLALRKRVRRHTPS